MNLNQRIGRNVQRRREARGWSQQQLADRIQVERPYVSMIEAGVRSVSLEVLAKLATVFQCSMGEVLGERPRAQRRAR
jgi:transcriptional regulator with XRE-family HTH domain